MDCSTPGFPVLHHLHDLHHHHHHLTWSCSLTSIESLMPSSHLILCRLLLLLPSIFPSIRVFSNESVLCIRWPQYWSFSFSISPSSEYSWLTFISKSSISMSLMVWKIVFQNPCHSCHPGQSSAAHSFQQWPFLESDMTTCKSTHSPPGATERVGPLTHPDRLHPRPCGWLLKHSPPVHWQRFCFPKSDPDS